MKKNLLSLVFLLVTISLTAQHDHLAPCGTAPVKSEWLKKYQLHPTSYETSRNDIIYVPLAVTVVGEDNGSTAFSDFGIQVALCVLNEDFEQAKIQFYLGQEVRHIWDSRYAQHSTVLQGAEMMFEYNVPDMVNCYFMQDAAGNCGYNLPYAGMCMSNNCAGPNDHTWAHEMGHQLALPHPFLGWEGGVSWDGSGSHNFDNPAPEKVTYNYTFFKDTLILDTLIIDTAYVEKVDGSNCQFAADGFCDTKPDYLAARWACDGDNQSPTVQTDPNGEKFVSNGEWIMSYALDNCSSKFSEEQIAAMRANLRDQKPELLDKEDLTPDVEATAATGLSPIDLEKVFPEDIELTWDAIPNATNYLVQLSIFENFQIGVFDTIVSSTSVVVPSLRFASNDHFWRVKAFTDYQFCVDWLEGVGSFTPDDSVVSSIAKSDGPNWSIYPTVLLGQRQLYVDTRSANGQLSLTLYDATGQIVLQRNLHANDPVDLNNMSEGLYIAVLSDGTQQMTTKIVVQ